MPSCKSNANQALDSLIVPKQICKSKLCVFSFLFPWTIERFYKPFPKGMSLESFLVSLAMVILCMYQLPPLGIPSRPKRQDNRMELKVQRTFIHTPLNNPFTLAC